MDYRTFFKKAAWILLIPVLGLVYARLNHNNGRVYNLATVLDQCIPFYSCFIIPYILWYGIMVLILLWFLCKYEKVYYQALISIVTGIIISLLVYSFFQTTVVRPAINSEDLCSQCTKFIYHIDNPYNAFPSIHVLTSCVIYLCCKRAGLNNRNIALFIKGVAILVIISTVFLKQHTLLDIAGGIFIGWSIINTVAYLETNHISRRAGQSTRELLLLNRRILRKLFVKLN